MDTLNYAESASRAHSPHNSSSQPPTSRGINGAGDDDDDDDEEGRIVFITSPENVPQLKPVLTVDGELDMTEVHNTDRDEQKRGLWPPPTRYLLALLACAGCMNSYALRVNLSVAIVAMVRKRHLVGDGSFASSSSTCESAANADETVSHYNSSTVLSEEDSFLFDWDEQIQSQILAAFFYGYILTQFIGGYLSSRYGAHIVVGMGILCTALLTLLTPTAAQWNPWALFTLRFLEGFGEGVTYPALHSFWSRWAPRPERATLIGIVYAGNQLGTIICLIVSGLLASSRFGWPSIFYVFGAVGVVWCLIWLAVTADSPQTHKFIRHSERDYIVAHTQQHVDKSSENKLAPVPWLSLLSSPQVLAICVAHFGSNWCLYTFVIELPTYMSKVLNFSLRSNGLLSALPYVAQWLCIIVCGVAADQIVSRTRLSTTVVRKVFTVSGLLLPALFIVLVVFSGCDRTFAVTCLIGALAAVGLGYGGYMINHIDVASEYAGSLMALSNSIATIPGFLVPFAVAQLIDNDSMQSTAAWQWFFYLSVLVLVVSGVFYALFASGERLKWLDKYML